MTLQESFLSKAWDAARKAQHLFPEYAACEAALESSWGTSRLAVEGNNLFGQKQSHPPVGKSLNLPTREYLHGAWLSVPATWVSFADWGACFTSRMNLLARLAKVYPVYAAALQAKNGEAFVIMVSKKWSTDPDRAAKVLRVWAIHHTVFAEALEDA